MPLSKARDRERKRLVRLESKDVQPRIAISGLEIKGNKIVAVQPSVQPIPNCPDGRYRDLDADGNVMPELT